MNFWVIGKISWDWEVHKPDELHFLGDNIDILPEMTTAEISVLYYNSTEKHRLTQNVNFLQKCTSYNFQGSNSR